jgi:predicted amidohydrolase
MNDDKEKSLRETSCTLGILQIQAVAGDLDKNAESACKLFLEAASQGAQLLVFPELFSTGYDLCVMKDNLHQLAQHRDGMLMQDFSALCRRKGVSAIIPFIEKEGNVLYNAAAWIDGLGHVKGIYRKRHLWAEEKEYFTPGNQPPLIVDTKWGRMALMICYDIDFPEMSRYAALQGAELLLLPTAWEYRNKDLYEIFLPSRAAENMMFVAGANMYQPSPNCHLFGNSRIINPRGTVVAQLPVDCEGVLLHDIDFSDVGKYRRKFPYLEDRHCDFT